MPTPVIGPERTANTDTAGAQIYPTVAAMHDGRFAIVWHDLAANNTLFQYFAADGTRLREEVSNGNATDTLENRIEAIGLPSNELLIVFQDPNLNDGDVKFRIIGPFLANGNYFGLTTEIAGANAGEDRHFFAGVTTPTGLPIMGFINGSTDDLRYSRFHNDSSGGGSIALAGVQEQLEGVAVHGGFAPIMVYRDVPSGEIQIRDLDEDGVASVGTGFHPHIADLGDGGVVVTWVGSAGEVLVRIFDLTDGNPVPRTDAAHVNPGTTGLKHAHVCTLQDGRFLVVWTDEDASGGFFANTIYGRIYDSDGAADSDPFIIDYFDSDVSIATGAPRVATLADGRVVVTYQDGESATSDISFKILDPRTEGVSVAGTSFDDDHVGSAFADIFIEGAGNDLVAAGSGGDKIYGGSGRDTLLGEAGSDTIDGGTGADTMEGGTGNDTYVVDHRSDVVEEKKDAGNDTVNSAVDFSLRGGYVERLVLTGSKDIDGTGNSADNRVTGNSGDNAINGWTGSDILTGGGGRDVFVFDTGLDRNTNVDTITDFRANNDTIRLENTIFDKIGASLTASEFVANATGEATNGSQHILYDTTDGRLFYDPDGNGPEARVRFATLTPGLALDHLDFVVV